MKPWPWNDLTPREKEVALLVVEGRLNTWGIGRELGISRHTVRFHLEGVYKKLGIRFRRVQLAFEVGLHWKEINS
jgi:DNA-binding CsgD family transcriptional regulator